MRFNFIIASRYIAIAVALSLAGSAFGATTLTSFTDRASFNSTVGNTSLADFNNFQSGDVSLGSTPVDVGGFTVSVFGNGSNGRIDVPPYQSIQNDIDGTTSVNIGLNPSGFVTLAFDEPVTAFGADFRNINDAGFTQTDFVVASTILAPPLADFGTTRFFGFFSDTPFSSLAMRGLGQDAFTLDNVSFGSVSIIPEPSSWTLALLSVAGVILPIISRYSFRTVGL